MPKNKKRNEQPHTRTTFKSVLRIRPLLKKERDDHVVLEPLSDGSAVALHPSTKDILSPHSLETVQTGQDVEFYLDRVFPLSSNQEKVYFNIGQPIALASMDALKHEHEQKKTHLILAIGLTTSGKSHTSFGTNCQKRKNDTDGLAPRMVDSLFSQSVHSVIHKSKVRFGVELSILQVSQNKANPTECQIHDLLQPLPKTSSSTVGSIASTLLDRVSSSAPSARQQKYAELQEPVKIQQDPVTSECYLANGTVKQCFDNEDARQTLQKALSQSRQLSCTKHQCHIFLQMQPVLVSNRSGRIVREGETIAILDMASYDFKQRSTSRSRDSLSNRDDAHTAVMHCLKAIQYNEEVTENCRLLPSNNKLRKVPFLQHKATMLLQPLFSSKHTDSTNVVLLMTASPSSHDHTENKALLTEVLSIHRPTVGASTGFVTKRNPTKHSKTTDPYASDADDEISDASNNNSVLRKPLYDSSLCKPHARSNTSDTETSSASYGGYDTSLCKPRAVVEREHSMTYSDLVDDSGFPPPVAPDYTEPMFSPAASAPVEEEDTAQDEASVNGGTVIATTILHDEDKATQPKFSYMETISKVVHASKKTGRKVIERMTVTTYDDNVQSSLEELKKQNAALIEENKKLVEKNKQLEVENENLKNKKRKKKKRTKSHNLDAATFCDIKPGNSIRTVSVDDDNSLKMQDSQYAASTIAEDEAPPLDEMFDDPLLQHMANMNNLHATSFIRPVSQTSVPEKKNVSNSRHYADNYDDDDDSINDENTLVESQMGRPKTAFDDVLLQHMAMMSNMG